MPLADRELLLRLGQLANSGGGPYLLPDVGDDGVGLVFAAVDEQPARAFVSACPETPVGGKLLALLWTLAGAAWSLARFLSAGLTRGCDARTDNRCC
jgi:hypothetical protein